MGTRCAEGEKGQRNQKIFSDQLLVLAQMRRSVRQDQRSAYDDDRADDDVDDRDDRNKKKVTNG